MRKRAFADSQNLDSLLDTMANVIGILVVILAVTQISVGEAMKRIRLSDDLAASEHALAQAESDALGEELSLLEARLEELEPEQTRRELASQRDDLSRLRSEPQTLRLAGSGEPDAATLAATLARENAAANELEQEVAQASRELASLRISLQDMPDVGSALTVRLPDPRPAPRGTKLALFFARHGRVFRVDFDQLEAQILDALKSDPRLTDLPDLGSRELRWVPLPPRRGRFGARLSWRSRDAGETTEQIARPDSALRKALAELHPKKQIARFHVWPDSYDVYLRARQIVEGYGFHVGWEPFDLEQESDWWVSTNARDPAVPID